MNIQHNNSFANELENLSFYNINMYKCVAYPHYSFPMQTAEVRPKQKRQHKCNPLDLYAGKDDPH